MDVIVRKPSPEELEQMGVAGWPIWSCEPSEFDWFYDDPRNTKILNYLE